MNPPKVSAAAGTNAATSQPTQPAADQSPEAGSFRGNQARILDSKKEKNDTESIHSSSFSAINEQAKAQSEPGTGKNIPSGEEISTCATKAKSGGLLGALRNLVKAIINFFLTPDSAKASDSSGFPGWKELTEQLHLARSSIEDTGRRVSNLSGDDLRKNLGSDQNMLARLIEPAEAMQAFTSEENARKLLSDYDLPERQKDQLAKNLQAGAGALVRLLDAQCTPAGSKLKDLAGSATFRDFASTDLKKNPYLLLSQNREFSSSDGVLLEERVRSWLNDAIAIYDQAARIIESSARAQEYAGSAAKVQKQVDDFAGAGQAKT